jgi:hypothetical protein
VGERVKYLVCQVKLRTANERSRRFMDGAAFAQRNQKQTESMRIQPGSFEHEVDQLRTPYHY